MTREQDTARKIVDVLNYGTAELDRQTSEQLSAARRKALAAAQPVRARQTQPLLAGVGPSIQDYFHDHHAWMPALIVISAVLLVFVALQQNNAEPVEADALLLASDLPPEAYVDKGFDAWLENTSRRR